MTKDQLLISHFLSDHPEVAIAEIAELSSAKIAQLILSLDAKNQTIILSGLASHKAAKVLEKTPLQDGVKLIHGLPFLVSEAIVRNLNGHYRSSLLELLPGELANPLERSLSYQNAQVGSHIDPNAPSLRAEMSIQDAINYIKSDHVQAHRHFFVVNDKGTLVGCLETTALLTADPEKLVKSVLKPAPAQVTAEMSVKDVLENWNEAFFELPVTTVKGDFLGIVTRQTLKGQIVDIKKQDHSAIKAGNALADLYLIGLTSLMGSSDTP